MAGSPEKVSGAKNVRAIDRVHDDDCLVLSVEEAGRKLGLSRAAAYQHAKAGHLPLIKIGNRTLVPKAALARMLAGE